MNKGVELDKHVADVVANAMKDWAIEKGNPLQPLVPAADRLYCGKSMTHFNPGR